MIENVIPDEGLMQPSGPAVQKIDTEDYSQPSRWICTAVSSMTQDHE